MPAISINSNTITEFYQYNNYEKWVVRAIFAFLILSLIVLISLYASNKYDKQQTLESGAFWGSMIMFVGITILGYISERKEKLMVPFITAVVNNNKRNEGTTFRLTGPELQLGRPRRNAVVPETIQEISEKIDSTSISTPSTANEAITDHNDDEISTIYLQS
jgi:hypothetical protein